MVMNYLKQYQEDLTNPQYCVLNARSVYYSGLSNLFPYAQYSQITKLLNVNTFCSFNPLNTELNRICHRLVLLGAHHILHVSWVRVNAVRRIHNHCCQIKLRTLIYARILTTKKRTTKI